MHVRPIHTKYSLLYCACTRTPTDSAPRKRNTAMNLRMGAVFVCFDNVVFRRLLFPGPSWNGLVAFSDLFGACLSAGDRPFGAAWPLGAARVGCRSGPSGCCSAPSGIAPDRDVPFRGPAVGVPRFRVPRLRVSACRSGGGATPFRSRSGAAAARCCASRRSLSRRAAGRPSCPGSVPYLRGRPVPPS